MPLLAESSKGDLPLRLGFLYACESLRKLGNGLVKASTCGIFSRSYLFKIHSFVRGDLLYMELLFILVVAGLESAGREGENAVTGLGMFGDL